ncbi:hypothetical protein WR25_21377 [Diploscapter pachys]|uniref:Eukaryotic translation initiation factor 3 subunit M n=1 Tax=Diploscapter pachys TaxID=2018661 RepID=A0A2A2L6M5_9BILA|nr:hypothetical protein WR25_21377 [Diploscapter pachys]
MADTKVLPVFAFIVEATQLKELRQYLNQASPGLNLKEDGPADITDNLIEICNNLKVIGKATNSNEVDLILNSVCSLVVMVEAKKVPQVIDAICSSLVPQHFKGLGWNSNAGHAVRVLSNLFKAFSTFPHLQEKLYSSLLAMCAEARLMGELDCSVETLQKQMQGWGTSVQEQRKMLRLVHDALLADQKPDLAANVMIMLLGTYTDKDAASAKEDAAECVRTAVVDPKSFSFDHLQRLSAVKALEKSDSLMYSALQLFISGTLKDYKKFVAEHPEFVKEKLKVNDELLTKKMRLLTLMSIAEEKNVIELDELAKQLELPADETLEEFIIEAVQVNAISGKINELSRTLVVSSMQQRQFGRDQWQTLQKRLQTLIGNLKATQANIHNINKQIDTPFA